MQSPEYPDLPFVQPRAWGSGRDGHSVQVIVVHYTAGSEHATSAEDGAAYDQRRTDGTSTHYFVDQNSIIQCVLTKDRANAALHTGNRIGIQYELCGTQQTRAQWLDPASDATLTLAAGQIARDCTKYGIPIVKLTPAQVRAGVKGLCGHGDITLAFPEDGGDHMDPGAEFPWDVLLARIAPPATTATEPTEGDGDVKEYVWHRQGSTPARYAVERPYHPDPAMRWEETANYEEAVGFVVAQHVDSASGIDAPVFDARKARYVAGGIGANDWADSTA